MEDEVDGDGKGEDVSVVVEDGVVVLVIVGDAEVDGVLLGEAPPVVVGETDGETDGVDSAVLLALLVVDGEEVVLGVLVVVAV